MITIISTKKSWIEGTAIQQLQQVHSLQGVKRAVGLPDLHAGPVGVAVASEGILYPHLVGSDIGCGMGFWQTNTPHKKAKLDRWVKKLTDLDDHYEGDITNLIEEYNLHENNYIYALGTIGHGNHFAELQKVEQVYHEGLFQQYGFDREKLTLLVHSGSRGLGRVIMDRHIDANGSTGLDENSPEALEYLQNHDYAVRWGVANRELIAHRFMESLNLTGEKKVDQTHNSVTQEAIGENTYWVHRKGANPNNNGLAIIAGSRGTFSYLVKPIGDFTLSNNSLAHGAGRKWKRSEMEKRVKAKHSLSSLFQTPIGSRVICEDRKLLYQEAPEAYKNIEQVIEDLKEFGLIEVIASYTPLITYKTREKR